MEIFKSTFALRQYLSEQNKSVGFVPTMGALHDGHMSLVQRCKTENELCVVSVYVNPTQFDNKADLEKYPRTLEKDASLLEENGCDVVFAPDNREMYPTEARLTFNFGSLERVMEGAHRDGHFNGVGLVVSKLFHMVQPSKAYFGLKDLQQVAIINQLVSDLSFPVEIVPCEIVRETSGLAMSSRNERLSLLGRTNAGIIYKSLQRAKQKLLSSNDIHIVKKDIAEFYKNYPDFKVEYFEIVDFKTLQPVEQYNKDEKVAICTAIFYEDVRLIDNIVF